MSKVLAIHASYHPLSPPFTHLLSPSITPSPPPNHASLILPPLPRVLIGASYPRPYPPITPPITPLLTTILTPPSLILPPLSPVS